MAHAGSEGHVHELTLGVHLEASDDGGVYLVLDGECLSSVGGVSLESSEHLAFLGTGESLSRDNSDLLLLVEGSVVSSVLKSNLFDEVKTLVFGEYFHESQSSGVERSSFEEGSVELLDFGRTDTLVIGEHSEVFRGGVEFSNVGHVLVDRVEGFVLRGSREQNVSVSTLNSLFGNGANVTFYGSDLGDVASRPGGAGHGGSSRCSLDGDGLSNGLALNGSILFFGDSGLGAISLLGLLRALLGEVSEGSSLSSKHTVLNDGDVACHHVSKASGDHFYNYIV